MLVTTILLYVVKLQLEHSKKKNDTGKIQSIEIELTTVSLTRVLCIATHEIKYHSCSKEVFASISKNQWKHNPTNWSSTRYAGILPISTTKYQVHYNAITLYSIGEWVMGVLSSYV